MQTVIVLFVRGHTKKRLGAAELEQVFYSVCISSSASYSAGTVNHVLCFNSILSHPGPSQNPNRM